MCSLFTIVSDKLADYINSRPNIHDGCLSILGEGKILQMNLRSEQQHRGLLH